MKCAICGVGMSGTPLELDRGVHSRCLTMRMWRAFQAFDRGDSLHSIRQYYPTGVALRHCDSMILARGEKKGRKPRDKVKKCDQPLHISGSLNESLQCMRIHGYSHAAKLKGRFHNKTKDEMRIMFMEEELERGNIWNLPTQMLFRFCNDRGEDALELEAVYDLGVRWGSMGPHIFITSTGETIKLTPKQFIDFCRYPKLTLFHILAERRRNEQAQMRNA